MFHVYLSHFLFCRTFQKRWCLQQLQDPEDKKKQKKRPAARRPPCDHHRPLNSTNRPVSLPEMLRHGSLLEETRCSNFSGPSPGPQRKETQSTRHAPGTGPTPGPSFSRDSNHPAARAVRRTNTRGYEDKTDSRSVSPDGRGSETQDVCGSEPQVAGSPESHNASRANEEDRARRSEA